MKTKTLLTVSLFASLIFLGQLVSSVSAASAGQKCLKAGTLSGTKQAPLVCAKVGGKLVWQSSKKDATTTVKETVAQSNAKKSATSYLKFSAFSRTGLIDQLVFEGYTQAQAEYGVSTTGL